MDAELFEPLNLVMRSLKVTGLWQDGTQSWAYFVLGHISRFIIIECSIVLIVLALDPNNLQEANESAFLAAVMVILAVKSWNFLVKIKNIQKSFRILLGLLEFSYDDRFKDRSHLKVQVAIPLKIFKFFWLTVRVNCVIGLVRAILTRQMPFKAWFLLDPEASEVGFYITLIFMTAIPMAIGIIAMSLNVLPVIFMAFGVGLINELTARLSEIGEFLEPQVMEKEFVKCIEILSRIRKYIKETGDNFSQAIFVHGFVSSLIICTNVYAITKVSSILLKKRSFDTLIQTAIRRLDALQKLDIHDSNDSRDFPALLLQQRTRRRFIKAFNCAVPLKLDQRV
jgi:hypothetical protein